MGSSPSAKCLVPAFYQGLVLGFKECGGGGLRTWLPFSLGSPLSKRAGPGPSHGGTQGRLRPAISKQLGDTWQQESQVLGRAVRTPGPTLPSHPGAWHPAWLQTGNVIICYLPQQRTERRMLEIAFPVTATQETDQPRLLLPTVLRGWGRGAAVLRGEVTAGQTREACRAQVVVPAPPTTVKKLASGHSGSLLGNHKHPKILYV